MLNLSDFSLFNTFSVSHLFLIGGLWCLKASRSIQDFHGSKTTSLCVLWMPWWVHREVCPSKNAARNVLSCAMACVASLKSENEFTFCVHSLPAFLCLVIEPGACFVCSTFQFQVQYGQSHRPAGHSNAVQTSVKIISECLAAPGNWYLSLFNALEMPSCLL